MDHWVSVLSFLTLAEPKLGCLVLIRSFFDFVGTQDIRLFVQARKDHPVQPAYFTDGKIESWRRDSWFPHHRLPKLSQT